jgi:thiosulfate dehydrogenase [quinone] large subunit
MTRRAILATLAAAALTACSGSTVAGVTKDAGTPGDPTTPPADDAGPSACAGEPANSAGPVTSYPQGKWKAVGDYIVGHDAGGLFAFSTSCTHQGCLLDPPSSTGATYCSCHGARFDGNGAVTAGPARRPLPHFALTVCDGVVYVDTNATVAASTRTAPA